MHLEKIHLERIRKFINRLKQDVYTDKHELKAQLCYCQDKPIPYAEIDSQSWSDVKKSEIWGKTWGSAWFRFSAEVPAEMADKEIGAWIDLDSEACIWKNGIPWLGLTNKVDWYHNAGKYFVPISDKAKAGSKIEILVEAAANDLFGAGKTEYKLAEASLVVYHKELFALAMDMELLLNLAENLYEKTVRRQKLLYGLNKICDLWQDGKGFSKCEEIALELLSKPANASALTAYSVGHAHIDLAWLWPIRETIRKGGRTFATALRLLESYPEYVFGASQAQLYLWMKEHYPNLYEQVKQAVSTGRWEIQGVGWVEFDTNLTGGESIIRQMLFGKRFFSEEFGISPDVLWLPDCFGFNANLPQLMQGCGVKFFMTQKLSWNESDTFPHSLFRWQGIDGSEVLAHQLPTNDYNFSNTPKAFLETEKRFAQSEVIDKFLNLFGIGDGGGGPGKEHIEYGLRQQNLEGVSRFKFAPSAEFFAKLSDYDPKELPLWTGELYLQFHRGTYTTQALMKKNNRLSESMLHEAELLTALTGKNYPSELTQIWQDTLLMQFHDIIPGSSIGWVYRDAAELSARNQAALSEIADKMLRELSDAACGTGAYLLFNAQAWTRKAWISLPGFDPDQMTKVEVPSYGYTVIAAPEKQSPARQPFTGIMENELVKVQLSKHGTILSFYDKEADSEVLAAESNVLKLWEDEPNNWAAWDINHFYRDTVPALPSEVKLLEEESFMIFETHCIAVFMIKQGNSAIKQTIELRQGEKLLRFHHEVDWNEHHKMLRVHFYPDIQANEATYEIQFGVVKRPTKLNTSWDKALFEVPAHRFADLSQPDYGVALINDSKYGYRIVEGEMELNLLRSPADVDPEADIHPHSYNYAFYPHLGSYEQSDVTMVAHSFNSPLKVVPASQSLIGNSMSFFELSVSTVKLETVKPAENGRGIVLRLYEYAGCQAKVQLCCRHKFDKVELCNMLEEVLDTDRQQVMNQDGSCIKLDLSFKPFEIKTLRLS